MSDRSTDRTVLLDQHFAASDELFTTLKTQKTCAFSQRPIPASSQQEEQQLRLDLSGQTQQRQTVTPVCCRPYAALQKPLCVSVCAQKKKEKIGQSGSTSVVKPTSSMADVSVQEQQTSAAENAGKILELHFKNRGLTFKENQKFIVVCPARICFPRLSASSGQSKSCSEKSSSSNPLKPFQGRRVTGAYPNLFWAKAGFILSRSPLCCTLTCTPKDNLES